MWSRRKTRAYHRNWQRAHPERVAEYHRTWRKKHPEHTKLAYDKWWNAHLDLRRANKRRWQKSHLEVFRACNHRRRARARGNGGSWAPLEWKALKIKFDNICLACGLGETQLRCLRRKLSPDHVIPLASGGRNDISNLQPLCFGLGGCNNKKKATIVDYRRRV